MESAHRGREEMIGRILRGGGAAFVPCRVAAMSPPGPYNEDRKTGENSKTQGAIEENQRPLRRRIAEHQRQEDAEEDYPSKSFLDHGSPRGPQLHNTVSVSSRGPHVEK